MAHNTRVRIFGNWANGTTIQAAEMEKFDAQGFAAINGDDGGIWTPTTQITIGGSAGLDARVLTAGDDGLGAPTFEASGDLLNGTNADFSGDVQVQGDLDCGDFTSNGNAEFFNVHLSSGGTTSNDGTIENVGTGTIESAGNKIVITDHTYLTRSPAPGFGHAVQYGAVTTNGSIVKDNVTLGSGGGLYFDGAHSGSDFMNINLLLNHNLSYNFLTFKYRGLVNVVPGLSVSTATLYLVDTAGNATLIQSELLLLAATPVNSTTKDMVFPIPFNTNRGGRYVVVIKDTENSGLVLQGITGSGNEVFCGRQ